MLAFQYGKENISLQEKGGQVGLQSIIKNWGFLSLGFLHCNTDPLGAALIWASLQRHGAGGEVGGLGTRESNVTVKLMILSVLRGAESLISALNVLSSASIHVTLAT